MATRCVFILMLFVAAAATLCGQEPARFPPSKPYRAELQERGPVREISVREAMATALAHNLEIEIENYGLDLSKAATANARSYYDPVADLNTSVNSTNLPVTNILQTGALDSQITKFWSVSPSIQQNLPGGGAATLTMNLNRTSNNSDYAVINPVFGSTIEITVTQPLLRGFRRTYADKQIVISQLNERMSESQFQQKVSNVVEQVISAYWRLAATIDYHEAQRQARDTAVAEYEQKRKEFQEGKATGQDLASQRSDVVSHEQSLTQAEVQAAQAANNLKRLLAPSVMDSIWATGLIASDRPEFQAPAIGLEEAVKTAVERRRELQQLRLQLGQQNAEVRFARQETKPAVNLRLDVLATGDAGTVYAQSQIDLTSRILDPSSPVYGGLGKSFRQAAVFQHPSVAGGLEIKLPLRNRAANSQLTTAVLGARKLQSQLQAQQEDILVEVRNDWESIAAQSKNVEAASLSRSLAAQKLAAEKAKSGSDAQNLDILRDQRDLADASVHELQALIDYQLSKVMLAKAMNTLVDDQQIVLARRNK